MSRFFAAAFLASTLMGAVNAMPLAPAAPATGSDIIAVAGGCGPGFHRGPYGGVKDYLEVIGLGLNIGHANGLP
jgi:hypothetical protein